ncbi:MAG: cache domain-containing protein [Arcobacteraceae bacterium]|nr:cache domain-containing protein [Arcobacteraceae bacterium]
MIRLFKNKSINQVTKITVVFTAIITLFITLVLFINTYNEHQKELKIIESDYIKSQKSLIKNETLRAKRFIEYKYNKYKNNLSLEVIKNQIVETIENMRDIRDGSGYIFIYTFDGINIADPILKQNSGKNLINFKDPNGKLVIKELIDISKQKEGGFVNYVWNKPTTNRVANKISYAISYEPFQWMIGSGVYLDDIQSVLWEKKREYKQKVFEYIIQILLFAAALFLTSMSISRYFTFLIQNDIDNIKDTLKNVSINYDNINLDKLTFKEFEHISFNVNLMINELKELNMNLEKKVQNRTQKLQKSEQFAHSLVEKQDKFIKNAIHEINTPLSIIITNIDLFKLKNGENRYLSKIEAGSKIIHNIYNDLSYLVKKDRIEYKPTNINFSDFLKYRVDFFDEIALGNNLQFDIQIEDNLYIYFNDTQLQRVCDNSLSNAIKYSYEKGVIFISLIKQNDVIIFSIKNEGNSIDNPLKLFERYYRENDARGGFGLGLNIIKEICDNNNVHIDVKSENNITQFVYSFQLK